MEAIFITEYSDPKIENKFVDRKSIKEVRTRQYITSLAVRAVFDRPQSVGARKLLNAARCNMQTASPTKLNRTNISRTLIDLNLPDAKDSKNNEKIDTPEFIDINKLFEEYDKRLKFNSRSGRHLTPKAIPTKPQGRSEKVQIAAETFPRNGIDAESTIDPILSPKEKSKILIRVLGKCHAQYQMTGKGPEDPRALMLTPIDSFSPQWTSPASRAIAKRQSQVLQS
jgi:hypothetical protein